MSNKHAPQARRKDVIEAIREHRPFAATPFLDLYIVLPTASPDHHEYISRKDRAYIKTADTGKILITAPSTYALIQKIKDGWKYQPDKKEGLFDEDQ